MQRPILSSGVLLNTGKAERMNIHYTTFLCPSQILEVESGDETDD